MSEEQDDLTLVYMYGFKNGEQSMKAEIERLRAALREYACNCPSGFCLSVGAENNDVCGDAARAALEGEKAND